MVDYLRTKSLWARVSFLSLEKSKILRILLCNTEKTSLKWFTGQKMNFKMNFKFKFSIKGFFSKCDQIRRKPRNCSNLLKKSLMENFIFCAVVEKNQPMLGQCFFYLPTPLKHQGTFGFLIFWGVVEEEHLPETD